MATTSTSPEDRTSGHTPIDDGRSFVVRVAQTSSAQTWSDPALLADNLQKVVRWYEVAADEVDLLVFPELNLTGYIPLKGYDQVRKRTLWEVAKRITEDELARLAALTRGRRAALVVGFTESSSMRHEMHNSLALLEDGRVLGVYRKTHLPVEENHYFLPGDGPVVIDTRCGRIALSICYDMVFPESARLAALAGAETLLVCSNWLGIANLPQLGEVLPVARALEEQLHVVFVNGVGSLEVRGRTWDLYGGSRIVAATGRTVAVAGGEEQALDGGLGVGELGEAADVFPLLRDRRPDTYAPLVEPFSRFAALASGDGAPSSAGGPR